MFCFFLLIWIFLVIELKSVVFWFGDFWSFSPHVWLIWKRRKVRIRIGISKICECLIFFFFYCIFSVAERKVVLWFSDFWSVEIGKTILHFCLRLGYWENVGESDLGSEILKYANISAFYCILPGNRRKSVCVRVWSFLVCGNWVHIYTLSTSFWFGEKTSVVWNSKICECFGFVLYCIFLVSEQKSNIYFVWWYFAFGNCAGVTGGTASGKTTVCDMIIQQLHDHRVVLVNQVIVITALY